MNVFGVALFAFVHVDDGFEHFVDALPVFGRCRYDGETQHALQTIDVERVARFFEFVEHVERHHHARILVDELRGQK